jgi:hypothetical protein
MNLTLAGERGGQGESVEVTNRSSTETYRLNPNFLSAAAIFTGDKQNAELAIHHARLLLSTVQAVS